MAEKSSGSKFQLWSLFDWLKPSPDNLTKQEKEQTLQLDGSGGFGAKPKGTSFYFDQITPQEGTLDHLAELEYMAKSEFISPFIDLYAEECTQPDVNTKKILWYECTDSAIEKELNEMLDRVGAEDIIYSIARQISATGNSWRRILRSTERGIEQLVPVTVTEVERIYDKTTRRLIGFDWKDQEPDPEHAIHLGERGASREIFAPWEFIHFRRMDDTETEYGSGLLDNAWPLYKRIKMATDQMVQYRMHMMPTRHALFIDTGEASIFESAETVNMFRLLLRNSVVMDPVNSRLDSRLNPPAMDSMLFFPRRNEENTEIVNLPGDKDIPDVYDLEHLYKQLFLMSRVPKAYLGFEENTGIAQASLVSQDIRFARMIRVLRKPLIEGFMKLAHLQLAFKGIDPELYQIDVEMSKISALEEELNAATLERQADMANTIVGLCQSLEIPNKEIMDLVFKEYLHVPRHFVDLAKLATAIDRAVNGFASEGEEDMMGGMGGGFGGGLGGGMGDEMGDMGGDLEADLGFDASETMPADDIEQPQEAKRKPSKFIPLTERIVGQTKAVCKFISEQRVQLNESKTDMDLKNQKMLIEGQLKRLRGQLSDIGAIHGQKKANIAGCYRNINPFLQEDRPIVKEGKIQLDESVAKVRELAAESKWTSGAIATRTEEEHPSVGIRRRAKQARG